MRPVTDYHCKNRRHNEGVADSNCIHNAWIGIAAGPDAMLSFSEGLQAQQSIAIDEQLQVPRSKSIQNLLGTHIGAGHQVIRITAWCSLVQAQMQEREKRLEREAAEVNLMCKRLECHVWN